MAIAVGDTVEVLGHRNAYGEDTSSWREQLFKTGQTFVVGVIEEDNTYTCPLVFPQGVQSEFWREDDLRIVTKSSYADRIRTTREARGVGLIEAKRIIDREDTLAEIDAAVSIDHIKAILRTLAGPPL